MGCDGMRCDAMGWMETDVVRTLLRRSVMDNDNDYESKRALFPGTRFDLS